MLLLVVSAGWSWVLFIQCTRGEKPINTNINSFDWVSFLRLLLRCTSHHNEKDQSVDSSLCSHYGWAMGNELQESRSRWFVVREKKPLQLHIVELKGKTSVYRFLHVITNWDLSLPRANWPNTEHLEFKWNEPHSHKQSTMALFNNNENRMNGSEYSWDSRKSAWKKANILWSIWLPPTSTYLLVSLFIVNNIEIKECWLTFDTRVSDDSIHCDYIFFRETQSVQPRREIGSIFSRIYELYVSRLAAGKSIQKSNHYRFCVG